MVLTLGPVFQVQSGKEENYIKCRKLRGCINRGITEGDHQTRASRQGLLKSHKSPKLLIKGCFRPKSIARTFQWTTESLVGQKKNTMRNLFSHENIESNSLDSTHQSDFWPQKVSNFVVGSSALDRSTQVNPSASPCQVIPGWLKKIVIQLWQL